MIELACFGGLEIRVNQGPITALVSRKADALIAYLACNPHLHQREFLADLLWDDRTQRQALGNLRVVLNSLRHTLASTVKITRHTVQLPRAEQFWADVIEFERLVTPILHSMPLVATTISDLHYALDLYRGEFLAGFSLRDASQFDEWASFQRERFHIGAVRVAQILASHYYEEGDYAQGTRIAQRWVQLDPLNEKPHQTFMELLVQGGQRTAAIEHFQKHLNKTTNEGITLSGEFESFYQRLARDELTTAVEALQVHPNRALQPTAAAPHNLPSSLLPLIGRTDELHRIRERLKDESCRLLTITGMGGIGKTRLATEAGQLLAQSEQGIKLFRDGIFLVRLERIGPEQPLLSVIATTIGCIFQGSIAQSKQFLRYLRNRRILLILDNFEHMLQQSDFLLEILHNAPDVKIMVTSRIRLDFLGEWVLAIEGLPYPSPSEIATAMPSTVLQVVPTPRNRPLWQEYPATNLFLLTARSVHPSFVAEEERDAIVTICRLLDGLPLGIQLAAAAVRIDGCQEIAAAIQTNIDSINSTMRNLPERHRSLRAVFTHSWNLLSAEQQVAFANLAIFVGGFSETHVEAIIDVPKAILLQLCDKSLIQLAEDDFTLGSDQGNGNDSYHRYQMHPVLHQFAAEELAKDAENDSRRRRQHLLYFCRFVVEQKDALCSAHAGESSAAMARELENIRAAWRYALAQYWDEPLTEMLPILTRFYLLRGYLQDARAFLANAIDEIEGWIAAPQRPLAQQQNHHNRQRLLAHLYAYKAEFEIEFGRYENAILAAQSAIDYANTAKDHHGEAFGVLQWGIALNYQGLYRQAKDRLQHALTLAQEDELVQLEATAHRYLGINSFYQGDYTAGRLHHEVAIRLYHEHDYLLDELRTYHSLAMLYFYTGDYPHARQHYERCRDEYQKIGDRPSLSLTLNNLGAVSFHLGDYPNALHSFEEALVIRRQIGDRHMEGLILANMGLLAHLMNQNRQALDFCTQALEVSLEIGERDTEAYARTCLGHTLVELGRMAEATVNYEQAVGIRRDSGQLTQLLEPLAGLARVQLRMGNAKAAYTYVAEILPHLTVHTYAGIVELVRIYLTCYKVLFLLENPRANEILHMGYRILQDRSAKILDANLRKMYVENIIAHRELMTEYEAQMVG